MSAWLDQANKDSSVDFLVYLQQQHMVMEKDHAFKCTRLATMTAMDVRQEHWQPTFDIDYPAPPLHLQDAEKEPTTFLVRVDDNILQRGVRRIWQCGLLWLTGVEGETETGMQNAKQEQAIKEMQLLPPKQLVMSLYKAIASAEESTRVRNDVDQKYMSCLPTH